VPSTTPAGPTHSSWLRGSTSPYDPYAWRNGQPFTPIAAVKAGDDPAIDDDCGSMFRIQFPDGHTLLAWPEEIGRHSA
jgi:hypothetical protein